MDRIEAERMVLASLIYTDGRGIDETMLSPDDFSDARFRGIFSTIGTLYSGGTVADCPAILAALGHPKDGTVGTLAELNGMVFSGSNLAFYSEKLREEILSSRRKELHGIAAMRIRNGEEAGIVLDELSQEIEKLRARYSSGPQRAVLAEACAEVLTAVEERKPVTGIIKTGLKSVDDMCGGLVPGEYIVLAARPSCGKTTFAVNIAANQARIGGKTCVISLEMKAKPLAAKILAMVSGVNTKMAIRNPAEISHGDADAMLSSANDLYSIAEKIDVYDATGSELHAIDRAVKTSVKAGARLIILDYLQLIETDGENRNQQVSKISRWFKNIVTTLNVPGIALAQLSRESEKEKRPPRMSDLRDSGSIEQDADIIWFLHRGGKDESTEIIQAKGRTVGVGVRSLMFRRDSQTFHDIERNYDDHEQ